MSQARAVVFAYHDVGVRCLKTLLSAGVEVPLVVTVADDPLETQWYASVAATARDYGLNLIAPAEPNTVELERTLTALQPDFLFSFYYRAMLGAPLLRTARRGALNMHGSLLPKFRGRAPVNWAILKGAKESGATLHYMVERADAGDIVDQLAVPILQDDEAREVFAKVTVAAETILARSLPGLIAALGFVIANAGPNTKIIPGHGPTVDRNAVTAHRDMIIAVRDKIAPMVRDGKTLEQVVAAKPTADFDAKVQQPGTTGERFVGQVYAELKAGNK